MAVDDVHLHTSPCDRPDLANFDHGDFDFFSNSWHRHIPWQVGHGRTMDPMKIEGTQNDHTTKSLAGYYAYVDYTYLKTSEPMSATMYTKDIPLIGCIKIQFWYLKYGEQSGEFMVWSVEKQVSKIQM